MHEIGQCHCVFRTQRKARLGGENAPGTVERSGRKAAGVDLADHIEDTTAVDVDHPPDPLVREPPARFQRRRGVVE